MQQELPVSGSFRILNYETLEHRSGIEQALIKIRFVRASLLMLVASTFTLGQVVKPDPSQPTLTPQPGVLRNTLAAKQLTIGQKFDSRIIQTLGIRGLLGSAVSASFGQWTNTPGEWGQGWGAYGKRYASGFAGNFSRQVFAFGLETALHEDPRYFPSSEKEFLPRLKNVLIQTVVSKRDNGKTGFAYSRFASAFAAGYLSNTWQPPSTSGVSDGAERAALSIAGDASFYFLQEFIPFTRNSIFRRHP